MSDIAETPTWKNETTFLVSESNTINDYTTSVQSAHRNQIVPIYFFIFKKLKTSLTLDLVIQIKLLYLTEIRI